jgi:hypothetical protein
MINQELQLNGHNVIGTTTVNVVFIALLVVGVTLRTLGIKRVIAFVLLWVAGFVGLSYLSFGGRVVGAFLFVPYMLLLNGALLTVILRSNDQIR